MNLDQDNINAVVSRIVAEIGTAPGHVIPILHAIQKEYNYLPEDALRRICDLTQITPAAITGIATFFSQFRHKPVGRHIIRICTGTACHVKGAERVYEAFIRELKITSGEDTDPEKLFTLQKVACLGCCTIAPVIQIDDVTYGHVQTNGVTAILHDFLQSRDQSPQATSSPEHVLQTGGEIRIGLGSCCVASGSSKVHEALQAGLAETGISPAVKTVGCVGMCHRTPLLEISSPHQDPVFYDKVKPDEVNRILSRHFQAGKLRQRIKNRAITWLENVLLDNPANGSYRYPKDNRDPHINAFLTRQEHITTEFSGQIDPLDLAEYRSRGGFKALEKSLSGSSPAQVISAIKASGLRGRGGAGFSTGSKWEITRQEQSQIKYVICNGDEGDPGAFMDRMILESYPYRVIEGMILAAYAVGATQGYFYIRAEYPLAVQRIKTALEICREQGLLGENILACDFSLQLEIMEGAGAFVCGEETALIASLEGKRGNPSFRPPYPAQKGLWGQATLVNNCETLATIPWIVSRGPEAFARLGTPQSRGTKVFSLAGKIKRGGLIEVPMGITIREIVEDIGGGIENDQNFKAVQIGGPSGGCLPADLSHTRVDYEDLTEVGAMMGSGGLLVMDDSDCMVDIARYFLTFTCTQSCGKCTFCRIGTRQMLNILEKLCAGRGAAHDLEELAETARLTQARSLCGLGKTAPNPVLTTMRYFREEYEAHIRGECPAKHCRELIHYTISATCIGCTICAQKCPVKAIPAAPYNRHEINQELCIKCGTCREVCPTEAVQVI